MLSFVKVRVVNLLLAIAGLLSGISVVFTELPVFPIPLIGEHVPTSVFAVSDPALARVTSGPGFGNITSVISIVLHVPDPRLATNISGRAKKETAGVFPVPRPDGFELTMSTDAQFMYISLFPILLNQIHAKMARPAGTSEGIVNENSCPSLRGQDPS